MLQSTTHDNEGNWKNYNKCYGPGLDFQLDATLSRLPADSALSNQTWNIKKLPLVRGIPPQVDLDVSGNQQKNTSKNFH